MADMSNPVLIHTNEEDFDLVHAAEAEQVEYVIPDGDKLDRLSVIAAIRDDIEQLEQQGAEAIQDFSAFQFRVLKRKDAGVLAVAKLLETIPDRVVQAKLHQVYGGKVDSKGKVSKTVPSGDGDSFLKAAKAYRDATLYVERGIIPESWSRGTGQRAAIAEMLDEADRSILGDEIEAKSKISVSDTITRFFREYTPRQSPLFMNVDKLRALAEEILVNAEYIAETPDLVAEYSALVETIKTVLPKK